MSVYAGVDALAVGTLAVGVLQLAISAAMLTWLSGTGRYAPAPEYQRARRAAVLLLPVAVGFIAVGVFDLAA